MVDHTFVYTPAVRKIRELIADGSLGDLYYYDSTRVNLGLFQRDVNVIWDLAVHDLSILDYLMDEKPVAVSASGAGHIEGSPENIAHITLFYPSGAVAQSQRQLARAGQGPPDADRRQPADDRLRRPGAEREGQGLRPRRQRRRTTQTTFTTCASPTASATCGRRSCRSRKRC